MAEATIAVASFIVFVVHILTAKEPFITPRLFTNRNFVAGAIIATGLGVLIFGAMPLFGTMLQQMLGYPVMLAGMMLAPRSVGTALAMLLAGRLIGKIDARLLLFTGIALTGAAFYMMSGMSLEMDEQFVITSSVLMGIGAGFLFVPLSTMAFTTLPLDLRNEGTAMVALFRFIGTAVGVSMLQIMTIQNSAAVQSRLTEGLRPDNPNLVSAMPDLDFGAASTAATLVRMAARQAQMVAYVDTWWLLFLISMALLPLAFVMRMPKTLVVAEDAHMVVMEG
jgi:DHA2 family multidrug resistance protein